jgi:CHAT domain-containing protein
MNRERIVKCGSVKSPNPGVKMSIRFCCGNLSLKNVKKYRKLHYIKLFCLTWVCLVFLNLISLGNYPLTTAQTPPTNTLVQQGIQAYQGGQYRDAIALLNQALATNPSPELHNTLAQAYRQVGQLDQAIRHWESASQNYRDKGNTDKLVEVLTQQAQAYSQLGQNLKAIQLLETAPNTQNPEIRLMVQGALGNAYRGLGNYEKALKAHQEALEIAQTRPRPQFRITAWNNLGNVYTARAERFGYQAQVARSEQNTTEAARLEQLREDDLATAIQAYRNSLKVSETVGGIAPVKALLNLNRTLAKLPDSSIAEMRENSQRILTLLQSLPPSREKAYALINLGTTNPTEAKPLLTEALAVAQTIGDSRGQSFALGSMGEIYEAARQYEEAMQWTQRAELAAQQVFAADSLYRWQWQAGRIHQATGNPDAAIKSFKSAIATLQTIRGDILAANQELQFDFRDTVEPVYRGLIDLLLQQTVANSSTKAITAVEASPLKEALDTLELLKLAELQNFFGDECVQVAQATSEQTTLVQDNTAIIYSVVLDQQVAMIVQFPDQSLKIYPLNSTQTDLQTEIDQLRLTLEDQSSEAYLPQSAKVYDLLFRPLEADLTGLKTLVFVQDGVLRKIPMAALFDGTQFLIEKYAVANTPSLSLTDYRPTPKNLQALALGLSVERYPFAPLPNVQTEVDQVKTILGGTQLVDENFTLSQLQNQLEKQSYPVIHMATHGKFGVDAESTFLLAYDQRISIEELDRILRQRSGDEPIELLTMSACQTAAGDNRSALGIAGVAVRAGVKSALASLWYISDEATVPLIEEFYTQLNQPGVTKAEALRQAQLTLINDPYYGHPALWSPLVLIGNWS